MAFSKAFLVIIARGVTPSFTRATILLPLSKASRRFSAEAAIAVANLAWDVLKDSRPQSVAQGAFTSVLDRKEMDPMRYPNAKDFRSKVYEIRFKNVVGRVVAGVGLRCIGTCKAQKPPNSDVPDGDYLPQVAFDVIKSKTAATTRATVT